MSRPRGELSLRQAPAGKAVATVIPRQRQDGGHPGGRRR